jgi:hypothetical protein
VVPNLGVCDLFESQTIEGDGSSLVVADIPGLLEGAHEGVSDDVMIVVMRWRRRRRRRRRTK